MAVSTAAALELVAVFTFVSQEVCSSIWSHIQHYTHSLKLFKYFTCENREVIPCRQVWERWSVKYATELLLNPRK